MSAPVKVQIFGQVYSIQGELDVKYVQKLAKYVDEKMHDIADVTKTVDTQKVAVLAALAIADELHSLQCDLRHGVVRRNEWPERFGAGHAVLQVFSDKIRVAPIAFWPSTIHGQSAGECAFIKRHASDYGDIFHATDGEERVFGILVKNVVDDLDGVGHAFEHGANAVARLPAIDADADGFRFAGRAQLFHRAREA